MRRQVYLPSILIIRLLYSLSRRFSLVAGLELSVVTSLEPQSGFHWRCNFYRVKPVAAKGLLPPYRGELYPEKRVLKERTCGSITEKIKTGLTVRQGLCGGAGGIRTHEPVRANAFRVLRAINKCVSFVVAHILYVALKQSSTCKVFLIISQK